MGLLLADEHIASLRPLVLGTSWHGKHLPPITVGQGGGDERSSLGGTFNHDEGVTHARHDTVALHKVFLVRMGVAHELGDQPALPEHLHRRFAVNAGINLVEAVCQDTHCGQSVAECSAVGLDVDAVGQSAHNQGAGQQLCQPFHHAPACGPPVVGGLAGAHNAHDVAGVEVGGAAGIEQDGGIRTIPEAHGVCLVVQAEAFDLLPFCKLHLFVGAGQTAVHLLEGGLYPWRVAFQHCSQFMTVGIHLGGTAHFRHQRLFFLQAQPGKPGQCHAVQHLLRCHCRTR